MKEPILLDTNLLLLFVVGAASLKHKSSLSYLKMHKRLRNEYSEDDYAMLLEMIQDAPNIIITPNTMTETSNLLRHIDNPAKSNIALYMRDFIAGQPETYINSTKGAARGEFVRLGLTDAVLLEVSMLTNNEVPVILLTADLDLFCAAESAGYKALNFNHFRNL
jgi:hypothetical protein